MFYLLLFFFIWFFSINTCNSWAPFVYVVRKEKKRNMRPLASCIIVKPEKKKIKERAKSLNHGKSQITEHQQITACLLYFLYIARINQKWEVQILGGSFSCFFFWQLEIYSAWLGKAIEVLNYNRVKRSPLFIPKYLFLL